MQWWIGEEQHKYVCLLAYYSKYYKLLQKSRSILLQPKNPKTSNVKPKNFKLQTCSSNGCILQCLEQSLLQQVKSNNKLQTYRMKQRSTCNYSHEKSFLLSLQQLDLLITSFPLFSALQLLFFAWTHTVYLCLSNEWKTFLFKA